MSEILLEFQHKLDQWRTKKKIRETDLAVAVDEGEYAVVYKGVTLHYVDGQPIVLPLATLHCMPIDASIARVRFSQIRPNSRVINAEEMCQRLQKWEGAVTDAFDIVIGQDQKIEHTTRFLIIPKYSKGHSSFVMAMDITLNMMFSVTFTLGGYSQRYTGDEAVAMAAKFMDVSWLNFKAASPFGEGFLQIDPKTATLTYNGPAVGEDK